jgi:8-oxo-dGTP diphosphatase
MADLEIQFHDGEFHEKELLKFAVIAAVYNGKWIFCRHKMRDTYEIPGGHREPGEDIQDTARRELWEETGAVRFELSPVAVYSVTAGGTTTYGKLFYARVHELGPLPEMEIGEVVLLDELPERLTYPTIQPLLFKKVKHKTGGLF